VTTGSENVFRFLSHPQVNIDPDIPITDWCLSPTGTARVDALCAVATSAPAGTCTVFTSPERKARDTATPIATTLGCPLRVAANSYENDRSATGYLPPHIFEATADQFFASPTESVDGWETAEAAQARIMQSMVEMLKISPDGDIFCVGHGAVGALLYCALAKQPISRLHDQGPGGGGNYFTVSIQSLDPIHPWRPMEALARV